MDIQSNQTQISVPTAQQPASPNTIPPPPDGDTSAIVKDPQPDIPIPATPSQTGLVSKAALPEKEDTSQPDIPGKSAAERTLKPYGINMLPEEQDASKQQLATDPDPTTG